MEPQIRVLVVDDEEPHAEAVAESLERVGYECVIATSGREGLRLIAEKSFDIVLTDLCMPGVDGMELLRLIKEKGGGADVVLMTGHGSIETAVQAMRMGACDFLTKPLALDDLIARLERVSHWRELMLENQALREQLDAQQGACGMVGASPRIQDVFRTALRYARKRPPVLITGESGTGKELVARFLHSHGPNPDEPFLPIDCSALSGPLIESELFGHTRGAFTGAVQDRLGLLASAGKGTAFLDEIGELPLELQAKLLRALQEREFRPVGSNRVHPFAARIVAASNRDLAAAVRDGKFRSDLYYRLNVLALALPPLRDRKTDIGALAQYFIARHSDREDGIAGIAPDAMERLQEYEWPGNVRELENAIQRALAVSAGPLLSLADFPAEIRYAEAASSQYTRLEQLERQAIIEALQATGGHRLRAAGRLGIGKTTMYRKLKDYGLDDNAAGEASDS